MRHGPLFRRQAEVVRAFGLEETRFHTTASGSATPLRFWAEPREAVATDERRLDRDFIHLPLARHNTRAGAIYNRNTIEVWARRGSAHADPARARWANARGPLVGRAFGGTLR